MALRIVFLCKMIETHARTGQNPKAFAFSNPGKLARQAARSHDVGLTPLESFLAAHTKHDTLQIKEKRLHVPLVDRLPDEPPPRLVTIVGPPGVGKTTLLWATPRSMRGSIGLADR